MPRGGRPLPAGEGPVPLIETGIAGFDLAGDLAEGPLLVHLCVAVVIGRVAQLVGARVNGPVRVVAVIVLVRFTEVVAVPIHGLDYEVGPVAVVIQILVTGFSTVAILIHAVADEETGSSHGTKYLVENGYETAKNVDMAVVGEGSVYKDRIHVRTAVRGAHWLKITTRGRSAHASRPEAGVSARMGSSAAIVAPTSHRLRALVGSEVPGDDFRNVCLHHLMGHSAP